MLAALVNLNVYHSFTLHNVLNSFTACLSKSIDISWFLFSDGKKPNPINLSLCRWLKAEQSDNIFKTQDKINVSDADAYSGYISTQVRAQPCLLLVSSEHGRQMVAKIGSH